MTSIINIDGSITFAFSSLMLNFFQFFFVVTNQRRGNTNIPLRTKHSASYFDWRTVSIQTQKNQVKTKASCVGNSFLEFFLSFRLSHYSKA